MKMKYIQKFESIEIYYKEADFIDDKIVQRFYETRLCRSVWRKAKIPIPATSYGVFRNFIPQPTGRGTALSL
jgi:hypothetical protein